MLGIVTDRPKQKNKLYAVNAAYFNLLTLKLSTKKMNKAGQPASCYANHQLLPKQS